MEPDTTYQERREVEDRAPDQPTDLPRQAWPAALKRTWREFNGDHLTDLLVGSRDGRDVGDRVVGQDPERAEADGAAQVGRGDQDSYRRRDGQLGVMGHQVARVHRRQSAREVALAGHGERRAADPRDERQQGSKARDHGPDAHHRQSPPRAGRLHRGGQWRSAARDRAARRRRIAIQSRQWRVRK